MGHIGLTPQGISVLGGFRAQGRTAVKAKAIVDDAMALQDAGAFSLVVECVPAQVARAVTDSVKIPVIGIGAGSHTDGQVLVYHDLLGIMHHPHFAKHVPSFCKPYSKLGGDIHNALSQFRAEVLSGEFPSPEYSPYKMPPEEMVKFDDMLRDDKEARLLDSEKVGKKLHDADEYETIKLY
jgi:3-methyl-2-oxobutanoate hydroxymethyltransferase